MLVLENFIEYLGQEPERNLEIALYMRGFSVRVPSTDAMVKFAKKCAEKGEAESALRLFIKVLETDPDRTDVLDASAELLAELGDVDGAKDLLLKSVELSPNKGHAKYVLLGHMEHGKRAVEAFERGYDLLKGTRTPRPETSAWRRVHIAAAWAHGITRGCSRVGEGSLVFLRWHSSSTCLAHVCQVFSPTLGELSEPENSDEKPVSIFFFFAQSRSRRWRTRWTTAGRRRSAR